LPFFIDFDLTPDSLIRYGQCIQIVSAINEQKLIVGLLARKPGAAVDAIEHRQLLIPQTVLLKANSYWIRTRHQDKVGLWSPWSNPVTSTTVSVDPNDLDGNGIDDDCQVQGYVDTNGNGIDDNNEAILPFYDAVGGDVIGMGTSNGTLGSLDAIPTSDIPAVILPADSMPNGFFSFRVDGLPIDPGNPATVDIIFFFADPLPADTNWYKYDPAAGTMTDFTANVVINGNNVVMSLTDGGLGDADCVVNGIIVDPVGPAVPPAASGGGTLEVAALVTTEAEVKPLTAEEVVVAAADASSLM